MFQIKAIFSVLLRQYDFELVDSADTYVDDYREMIVQPKSPCRIRYRRKENISPTVLTHLNSNGCPFTGNSHPVEAVPASLQESRPISITIDRQLCQGHGMCMGEAPEIFRIEKNGDLTLLKSEIDNDQLKCALSAEKHCPNQAIKVNWPNRKLN